MSDKTYKNPYTLDGRLKFGPGVTIPKMQAVETLVGKSLQGDHIALGQIREALTTTSDFAFNLAALVNAQTLPDLDDVERTSDALVGRRQVSDFRDNYLYTLARKWAPGVVGDGQVNEPLDFLPTVPEGTVYPEAIFSGELIQASGIRKTGLATGITWEAIINDTLGIVSALPNAFRELALNTPERDAFTTLINGVGAGQQLQAGTAIDGTTVVANATLSRAALAVAKTQLRQRYKATYGGAIRGGFNLVVAVGQKEQAEWYINNVILSGITDGPRTLTVNAANDLADITVIESVYVEGTAWYLAPKPGTTARPVLDRLSLIGHEQAELRVNNLTGNYLGGSTVPPFEGSFINDTADFRVRLVTGTVLWSPDAIVWSEGDNT